VHLGFGAKVVSERRRIRFPQHLRAFRNDAEVAGRHAFERWPLGRQRGPERPLKQQSGTHRR
jgi:hypothetical protein